MSPAKGRFGACFKGKVYSVIKCISLYTLLVQLHDDDRVHVIESIYKDQRGIEQWYRKNDRAIIDRMNDRTHERSNVSTSDRKHERS